MNPRNIQKRNKLFCGCCAKNEDFDSNEVIFECFGNEFTEYEYIIENLAIRPAPKKLLDLVPVHSTNISKKSIYKIPTMENQRGEVLHKTPSPVPHRLKLQNQPTEYGDCKKPESPVLKIREPLKKSDDFISLKILPDDAEPRMCGPCNPAAANYNPCINYPYDEKPCGSCRVETFPEKCKPINYETIPDVLDLRRTIKSQDYRTTKQILSDLCQASEQSLQIKQKNTKLKLKSMPTEIKDTIETLKFKKPLPQFFTRTEKKPFHKPGVYFADVKQESTIEADKTMASEMGSWTVITDSQEKMLGSPTKQQTSGQSESPNNQSGKQRIGSPSQSPILSNQSGQQKIDSPTQSPRLSGQSGQKRLSQQSGKQRLSTQMGPQRFSGQSGQPRLSSNRTEQLRIYGQRREQSWIKQMESDTTIDDLSEHDHEKNISGTPAVDSTAQTDICKCPSSKKPSKNLKWKIIINKHSNCKC